MKAFLKPLLWIALLGMVATALHNFVLSLSMDGPLYANIANNILRYGDWFRLDSGIPEFQPYFAEHPHLGFWVLAGVIKIFGTGDWAVRILGHILYILTLYLFFVWQRRREPTGSQAPYLFVALLWITPLFSRFFGQVYLDPLFFFFGVLALYLFESNVIVWSVVAGVALAFSAMTKGLAFLAFGPIMAYIAVNDFFSGNRRRALTNSACAVTAMIAILALYRYFVLHSNAPDFLTIYFRRQWENRFAGDFVWARLFEWTNWQRLFKESHYLGLIVPALIAVRLLRSTSGRNAPDWRALRTRLLLPLLSLLSFAAMLMPADRVGAQYSLTMLPWLLWLVAIGIAYLLQKKNIVPNLVRTTSVVAIVALALTQFLPVTIRKSGHPQPLSLQLKVHLDELERKNKNYLLSYVQTAEFSVRKDTFLQSANWSWYTKREVVFTQEDNLANPQQNIIVVLEPRSKLNAQLAPRGFCLVQAVAEISVWTGCQSGLLQATTWMAPGETASDGG